MKRRLTRAYDSMTMPDGCAHRIEQKLNDQLLQQKTGQYVRSIPPEPVKRRGWAAAVAAVCLMLVLSVGGTALLLWTSDHMRTARQETIASVSTETTEMPTEPAEENQKKQVPREFADVLSGQSVKITGSGDMTLDEYTAALWGDVTVNAFAVVDMDGDNVCETVTLVENEQGVDYGFLVLRLEGEEICAYPFRYGEMYDLKKDGSFNSSEDISNSKKFRLSFEGAGVSRLHSEAAGQQDLPVVDWYVYPCQGVELVLRSYEYVTGVGWSSMPGAPYYYFDLLAKKEMLNDWNYLKEEMTREGRNCVEADGTVFAFESDAPGAVLYGTLTEENGYQQFETLGLYICTEEREYQAEVREMLSDDPQYVIDVMDPERECPVQRPEFLVSYFGWTISPEAEDLSEKETVRTLTEEFSALILAGDTEAMEHYLAEDFQKNGKDPNPVEAEILAIQDLPEQVALTGERCNVMVTLGESGTNRYFSIDLTLVKQKNGWKVQHYSLWE